MTDGGVNVAPQVAHDETGFKVGNLVGQDAWVIRTNRSYRIKLSESLDEAADEAKRLHRPFSAVVQFRSAHDLGSQYVVLGLDVFTELVRRQEGV